MLAYSNESDKLQLQIPELLRFDINELINTKQVKQSETRQFCQEVSIESLLNVKEPTERLCQIIQQAQKELTLRRTYQDIFPGISSDNLRTLELLGIGRYERAYVVHVDLSDKLDYFLHRLSGCNMNAIHLLNNYDALSYNILNLKLDDLHEVNLHEMFGLDKKLDSYFLSVLGRSTLVADNSNIQSVTQNFAYNVINDVLQCTLAARNLIATKFMACNDNIVLRSHGYCDVIGTTDKWDNGIIELYDSKGIYDSCFCKINYYKPLEYAYQNKNTGGAVCNLMEW